MTNPTDSDTTDKACGFDEKAAMQHIDFVLKNWNFPHPKTKIQVTQEALKLLRWQHSQDQAAYFKKQIIEAELHENIYQLNESLRDARKSCNEYALCIDLEQKKSKELSESNRVLAEALSNSIQQCGADSCSFPKCACHVEAKQALESAGVGK